MGQFWPIMMIQMAFHLVPTSGSSLTVHAVTMEGNGGH